MLVIECAVRSLSTTCLPRLRSPSRFEVCEVTRRLLLSGVLVCFGAGTLMQVFVACTICLISIKIFTFYVRVGLQRRPPALLPLGRPCRRAP